MVIGLWVGMVRLSILLLAWRGALTVPPFLKSHGQSCAEAETPLL